MKKIKQIMFFTRSFPPQIGGMENFSHELFKGLCKKYKVKLVANTRGYKGLFTFFINIFIQSIFSKNYEFIYCNDILTSFFALPAKFIFKKRIYTTLYGLDITYIHYLNSNNVFNIILKRIYKLIFIFTINNISKLSAISEGTKNMASNYLNSDIPIINPGLTYDTEVINKSIKYFNKRKLINKYNIKKDKKIVLFFGRLIIRKGAFWFIENVLPRLGNKYVLFVVGNGPEFHKIYNLIVNLKLNDRVKLLGSVSESEKKILMKGSDLFIMPNIKTDDHFEGFGITAIESSSFGNPVIASNIDGITSAVKEKKNGTLFEGGNTNECLKAFSRVEKYNLNCNEISQYVKNKFSSNKMVNSYIKLFENN